ncbi:MAG: hypothetical protein QM831_18380 [Kofleriaceae bacterium]
MQLRALAVGLGLSIVASCGDNIHETALGGQSTPFRVVTSVTPNPVVAGDKLTVTCQVLDENNAVLTGYIPTLVISPVDPNTVITKLDAVLTKAGHYAAQCVIPDLAGDNVGFDVKHALPAKMTIDKSPNQTTYGINANITVIHTVADKYDNPIDDATIVDTSTAILGPGPINQSAPNIFSYASEGRYKIHGQVSPPTDQDMDVSADTELIVNQFGPSITCGTPGDATMLNLTPGANVTFTGTAVDTNGTMSVQVNGTDTPVDADGNFSATMATRFGINFVDIKATDEFGVDTVKVCSFLVANRYSGGAFGDLVSLKLNPNAVDDHNRAGGINSLGDLLNTVANSAGLHDTLDASLRASNPLHPNTCDQQVCIPFTSVCTCVLSDQVDYLSSSLPGPNTDSLSLVQNGLAVTETISNAVINLRVHGAVAGIGYDTSGPVTFSSISVTATFDLGLVGGTPHMSVRANSVSVSVGSISTNFNGVDGWIISNILVPLAQGTLKNAVANLVKNYIQNNFNAVLDGVVGNLDVSSLGASFDVPRIDSTGNVALAFAPGFSSISTTTNRMLFGLSTSFTAAINNSFQTLGAAIPPQTVLSDPAVSGTIGVAANIGILNQALHALWRADYFHATLDASQFGGFTPPGPHSLDDDPVMVAIDARLPPVAYMDNGVVRLDLGDVDITIGNSASAVSLSVGIRAHTNVTLTGNVLSFSGITLDETHLSSDALNLNQSQQMQLEALIANLVQSVINSSLNGALPSLPIPSFTLPASLATYGLPAGASLGIVNPTLQLTPPHFVLSGNFGIQ